MTVSAKKNNRHAASLDFYNRLSCALVTLPRILEQAWIHLEGAGLSTIMKPTARSVARL